MEKTSKIFVAGHRGMVGSSIVRRLRSEGYENIIVKTRDELDLCDQSAVREFFETERPEYVFLAAAKVGGILANRDRPAEFLLDNLVIETNVIDAAYRSGVAKLLFLGSSCIYPRECPQPIREDYLLTGPLESTNEPYAIAKIAGIKLCQSYGRQYGSRFVACMPTNLYGPGDNFDLASSHVMPAMIRKFHEAKISGAPDVTLWGDGSPYREFLHVDDMADACVAIMRDYEPDAAAYARGDIFLNVGTGKDVTIRALAETVRDIVGYAGEIVWDTSKPNGTPRKLLDVSRLAAEGWNYRVELADGVRSTYEWFLANEKEKAA